MKVSASVVSIFLLVLLFTISVPAQTTEFTYQGSLTNGGNPASGNYDFEFALFDAVAAGTQIGSTLTRSTVAVTNGDFSVKLDFGSQFPGANRFLEIHVRQTGGGAFTPLTPRQLVNSSPYSIQSLNAGNATQLGGVAANQYVTTTGGGANFIQNTTSPQASSNFNISGNGAVAGTLSAYTINLTDTIGYSGLKIGGQSALRADGFFNRISVGIGAGFPPQPFNTFVGGLAGANDLQGTNNSFFGAEAGLNSNGHYNSFFGVDSGITNTTGSQNTIIGFTANVGANNLSNATAIGTRSLVSQSNSLVLGSINGVNGATANTNVGIGTTAPEQALHVNGTEILSTGNGGGFKFRDRASASSADDWVWYSNGNIARFFRAGVGDLMTVKTNGNVGLGTANPNTKLQVAGGSVYITNPSSLIITSPNGACWFITVNNAGALSTISVTCP